MYKLTNSTSITRLADSASIPNDPANIDYSQYLQWLSEGNIPESADPLPAPPIVPISPRQIRQALTRAGFREAVESAVAAGDQDLKDWYEFAAEFDRYNPHVVTMGEALGKTPEQLDSLWKLGASL